MNEKYKFICDIVNANGGCVHDVNELLIKTGIDSFAVLTVLLEVDDEFSILKDIDFDKIDYTALSIHNIANGDIKCI